MAEPDLTLDGPLTALVVALTALVGGVLEYLRRRMMPPKETQLDRIEAQLQILVKALVVTTEDGGRVAVGRSLAGGICQRLDKIERLLERRGPQLGRHGEKLDELAKTVDSLSAAVQSAVEMLQRRTRIP